MKKGLVFTALALSAAALSLTQLHAQRPTSRGGYAVPKNVIDEMIAAANDMPTDAAVRVRIGLALGDMGRAEEGARWLEEAAKVDPAGFDNLMGVNVQAAPRGGCTPSTGPDVIVGDITSVPNLGLSGSISAFCVATTSCNIGDQNVPWDDETSDGNPSNRHPVIAQNLYRLKGGLFEQIGMSWCKHGFTALTGNVCCTCSGQGGNVLGVGCSDPYSGTLNGSYTYLGPRWQVNAWTGDYAHPFMSAPNNSPIGKRLQVNVNNLDPTMNAGALYFAEAQYVAYGETTLFAGTQNNGRNNASYRRVTVGSTTSISLAATTQRQMPGIQAWKDNDATVTIQNVDVPSEGRFVVAYKVTDLGGGNWHYEYAIENINSHRSAQSLSIPAAASATLSAIGFHDVDYHSGDGAGGVTTDGGDWPGVSSGGLVTWQMPAPVNPVADPNALRWGTMYNFRFDAKRPPTAATATLGLYRAGSPTSVTFTVMAPSTPVIPCPADLDGDGMVGSNDAALLLGGWGGVGPANLDGVGVVGSNDLAILLGAWGPCP